MKLNLLRLGLFNPHTFKLIQLAASMAVGAGVVKAADDEEDDYGDDYGDDGVRRLASPGRYMSRSEKGISFACKNVGWVACLEKAQIEHIRAQRSGVDDTAEYNAATEACRMQNLR